MTAQDPTSSPRPSSRRRTWLRLMGSIMLALGLGGAGTVYWLGTRSPNPGDDPAMLGYNRPAERQMGLLYGKMGTLIEDCLEDLKQPGTQATLIIGFSVLVAGGCFYFARLPGNDDVTG